MRRPGDGPRDRRGAAFSGAPALSHGSSANGRIAHLVSAGGTDFAGAGVDANWSLHVTQFADGSVKGHWSDEFGHGYGGVQIAVTCLHVAGNEAWVGGVSKSGLWAGRSWLTRVKDNGTSSADPADQISYSHLLPAGAGADCSAMPPFALFERAKGQVTVR